MTFEFLEQAKSGDRRSLARTLSSLENGLVKIEEVLDVDWFSPCFLRW